jgi:phosphomannomutase
VIERIVAEVGDEAEAIDRLDGASLSFGAWRMNLRASNTEPLLRLNVETLGDRELLAEKVDELSRRIGGERA